MNDHIQDFIHYLTVERGLANNTIVSYERDLKSYKQFLNEKLNIQEVQNIQRYHILQYLHF